MTAVLGVTGLCVLLLVVFCARLVAALDEAELALRSIVSSTRALSRAARQVAPVAGRIAAHADAGAAALGRLEALKAPADGQAAQ